MRRGLLCFSIVLASIALMPAAGADVGWTRVDAPAQFIDRDGVTRYPGCSGGPKLVETSNGIVAAPADTSYAFFIRHGDPSRLAILWDGGGACWDKNTCIGSALQGIPTYSLEVDETVEELATFGGIGDVANAANPIRDYTQVFIPYCTADLHTGSNDQWYTLTLPDDSTVPWLIRHRGYDNVAWVLDTLESYYETEVGSPPQDVFLAGASAGGYGVLFGMPAVTDRLPWHTRVRVLVDAANGVITEDFYNRALTPDGVWRAWDNLPSVLVSAFAAGPEQIVARIFGSLGSAYPRARFGQYTTAFDVTQIFFYNVARHTDDPSRWFDPAELVVAGLEWTVNARTQMILTAFSNWNFRYYTARGEDHTIVADEKFYTEDSAAGVDFVNWVDDMINRYWPWGSDWRNVSCAPNCLP